MENDRFNNVNITFGSEDICSYLNTICLCIAESELAKAVEGVVA